MQLRNERDRSHGYLVVLESLALATGRMSSKPYGACKNELIYGSD